MPPLGYIHGRPCPHTESRTDRGLVDQLSKKLITATRCSGNSGWRIRSLRNVYVRYKQSDDRTISGGREPGESHRPASRRVGDCVESKVGGDGGWGRANTTCWPLGQLFSNSGRMKRIGTSRPGDMGGPHAKSDSTGFHRDGLPRAGEGAGV